MIAAQMIFKNATDPTGVANGGSFRPLTLLTRPGSIFDAAEPAAFGIYAETVIRLYDLIWRCLAPHLGDRLPAGHYASICGTFIGGRHPDTGRHFTVVEPQLGGWGASANADGNSAMFTGIHGDTFNCPVEIAEARYGLWVEQLALSGAEGGAGERRGGKGIVLDYRARADGLFFTCAYTRSVHAPWAVDGGREGSRNYVELIRRDGTREEHAIATALELNEGDLIRIHTANGGGHGDPRRRPRDLVLADLRDGLITAGEAAAVYGLDGDAETLAANRKRPLRPRCRVGGLRWRTGAELIDAATREERLAGLRRRMGEAGLDLVALAPSDNLRYVLGFAPHYDERACMLLVTPASAAVLMPSLNAEQAAGDAPELELVTWSDDAGPTDALRGRSRRSAPTASAGGGRPGDAGRPSAPAPGGDPAARAASAPRSPCGRCARSSTDDELRAAAGRRRRRGPAMQRRLRRLPAGRDRAAGRDAARRGLPRGGRRGGRRSRSSAPAPTARSRTTTPATRQLAVGDAIVIDIGGTPRRLHVRHHADGRRRRADARATSRSTGVVEAAVQAGLAAAKPGRDVPRGRRGCPRRDHDAGFGEYFVHRTGHGLGISTHEPPWIMRGEDVELRPGWCTASSPASTCRASSAFGSRRSST